MRLLVSRSLIVSGAAVVAGSALLFAAGATGRFRVDVNMVMLSLTVTDGSGHYVNGLKPGDFRISEDGIPQKISAFLEAGTTKTRSTRVPMAIPAGSSVYVLFDTSNGMYSGFAYAQDAIADFIRSLDPSDSVAVYSFSRNLSRSAELTRNHAEAIRRLRDVVAGDETALINSLLLTLRDAGKTPGRKAIVVFSNGPDNASVLSPDDVRRVAEDEGIPIYVVSTRADNPVMNAVFDRLTGGSGGKSYFARNWRSQAEAFSLIQKELAHSYTIAYYPSENPNEGFRKIDVQIVGGTGKTYRVRTRQGYRPHPAS